MNWAERYATENTPWDLKGPHPELVFRLKAGLTPASDAERAFVPGCGRGHDAVALAKAGWSVTAVDRVEDLEKIVQPALDPFGGVFLCSDALSLDSEPFDLLWDHTFFCAIDPADRHLYGEMVRRLVRPGGRLAFLVYPVGRPYDHSGPPWAMSADQVADVLRTGFDLVEDEPVAHAGHKTAEERWTLFARK